MAYPPHHTTLLSMTLDTLLSLPIPAQRPYFPRLIYWKGNTRVFHSFQSKPELLMLVVTIAPKPTNGSQQFRFDFAQLSTPLTTEWVLAFFLVEMTFKNNPNIVKIRFFPLICKPTHPGYEETETGNFLIAVWKRGTRMPPYLWSSVKPEPSPSKDLSVPTVVVSPS